MNMRDRLINIYDEDLMFADGLDDCIIGSAEDAGVPIVVYDSLAVIKLLQERDGMTEEEAIEFFDFNIKGAWVGPKTPIFVEGMG